MVLLLPGQHWQMLPLCILPGRGIMRNVEQGAQPQVQHYSWYHGLAIYKEVTIVDVYLCDWSVSMVHWFCVSVHLIISLQRLIENTGCGIMSLSHTPNQASLRTRVMLNSGLRPSFNITQCSQLSLVWGMEHWYSVLRRAWFGVWDTDIIPQPVFSTHILGVFTVSMGHWFCCSVTLALLQCNKTNVPL